jgi:hypothetical protein
LIFRNCESKISEVYLAAENFAIGVPTPVFALWKNMFNLYSKFPSISSVKEPTRTDVDIELECITDGDYYTNLAMLVGAMEDDFRSKSRNFHAKCCARVSPCQLHRPEHALRSLA